MYDPVYSTHSIKYDEESSTLVTQLVEITKETYNSIAEKYSVLRPLTKGKDAQLLDHLVELSTTRMIEGELGFDGKIQNTEDGGASWSLQTSGTPYQLNSVYFLDQLHGWAVGENGTILKTISTTTGIDDIITPATQPEEFVLYNNYPNPFNPSTTISYNLPNANHTRLVVYNILGQEVRELVNGFYSAGKHEVVWDGMNSVGIKAASGIYFYTLEAGNVRIIKKMVLNK